MKVNGVTCILNMPESVKSDEESDKLPPYEPVTAHVVDEYPACPNSWMHGSSKASSYFVPVKTGRGMWLDFNGNKDNEHEIAVVISVQGVNPITGQKQIGKELRLEKYATKCPVHDIEFHQDRWCPSCSFKWPAQNFISSVATPNGQFWLDGFRSEDGKVRQYIVSPEEAKGVAYNVIDKDKPKEEQERVFAIGVAFYRSKEKKYQSYRTRLSDSFCRGITLASQAVTVHAQLYTSGSLGNALKSKSLRSKSAWAKNCQTGASAASAAPDSNDSDDVGVREKRTSVGPPEFPDLIDGLVDQTLYKGGPFISNEPAERMYTFNSAEARAEVKPLNYEVAAGARIEQRVHEDVNELSYWEEEPIGLLYINYADEASVVEILKQGKRKEVTEGFLAVCPVGN
jgi:hypothetical protein